MNFVSTANLNCKLDLAEICNQIRNSAYNPARFPALRIYLKDLVRVTGLLFKSGKMVLTGARDENQSLTAAK